MLALTLHNLARYGLVAPNTSYGDIAQIIAKVSCKDIQCNVLSPKEFVARVKASGEVRSEYAGMLLNDSCYTMIVDEQSISVRKP